MPDTQHDETSAPDFDDEAFIDTLEAEFQADEADTEEAILPDEEEDEDPSEEDLIESAEEDTETSTEDDTTSEAEEQTDSSESGEDDEPDEVEGEYVFELTIDGENKELTESEVVALAQKSAGADKRFREAIIGTHDIFGYDVKFIQRLTEGPWEWDPADAG